MAVAKQQSAWIVVKVAVKGGTPLRYLRLVEGLDWRWSRQQHKATTFSTADKAENVGRGCGLHWRGRYEIRQHQ